jgi:hypothetical protein
MKNLRISWILPLVTLLAALVAWVLVIWAALVVSTIVLNTLSQIVELAQMS